MARMIFLDNQSTTPCDPRVVAVMMPWFTDNFANPHSSEHAMGRAAEEAVEQARAQIAASIGAESREIVFTSGATESNNIAIKGAARHARRVGDTRRRVITLATEHKCVLESVSDLADDGFDPIVLPVRRDGTLNLERLADALATPTLLVSVMTVNNETGVIQDIAAVAALVKQHGALFHTDAAQALGKIPLDVAGIDLMSITAHKVYGPKGIGALYVRRRPRARVTALFSGGNQERGLRSGTLPTPLVVGFGEACRIAVAEMASDSARIGVLRDHLFSMLSQELPGLALNGAASGRIAGNLNLQFPTRTAADLMEACPDVCMSTGSACSSAVVEPSYVLRAMGLSDAEASRSLRIGIGRFTSATEIEAAAQALAAAHALQQA
jgi:cysteine desulfurase